MPRVGRSVQDLKSLVLPDRGALRATGDPWTPYELVDPWAHQVQPAATYFRDLLSADCSPRTVRSYGMDLLRWWRFLWAFEIEWDRAVRDDARDFTLWMKLADKPVRTHWRRRGKDLATTPVTPRGGHRPHGAPNLVTGKPSVGTKYAPRTRAHCETVLRTFYDFHLERNTGALLVNPFPLARNRRTAQRSSEEKRTVQRSGLYRPTIPKRIPRRIPEDKYTEVFANLQSHRDRALLAFWVATGARSEELLTSVQRDAVVGQQTIGVIRKGTRDYQELPATPDAFVWLRLYQEEAWRSGAPRGRDQPLWWTLRRPWRPLTYDAARMMFKRANDVLEANWTLHDLRHTATFLMLDDPNMPPVYVQHILGHKHLSTLDIYSNPSRDEVIVAGLAHHERQQRRKEEAPPPPPPAPAYNPASLSNLFGGPTS